MNNDIKVIAFDLDGVLFDGPSATYPIAKEIGIEKEFLEVLAKVSSAKLSLQESIIEVSKIWIGVPVDGTLDFLIERMPLMKGAEETVSTLKEWGYVVGCISSGVSQYFLKPLSKRLDLDFAFSNELGSENGKHDGTVLQVMDGPGKAKAITNYLISNDLPTSSLASVGDGENDLAIFRISSFSIAFNPTSDAVANEASITIRSKDLRTVLPHFTPDFP